MTVLVREIDVFRATGSPRDIRITAVLRAAPQSRVVKPCDREDLHLWGDAEFNAVSALDDGIGTFALSHLSVIQVSAQVEITNHAEVQRVPVSGDGVAAVRH